jgi:hypothetical protein
MNIFLTPNGLGSSLLCITVSQIIVSCRDSIEKYLFEYDYMDPFVVLIYEGIFGFFISQLLLISKNYMEDFRNFFKGDDRSKEIGLIFALIFYMIISGWKNLFRVVTTKIYSPMTKTLSDYILNPIYIIYYYGARKDFLINSKFNPWYFSINIILALIISFFGCVYNEFIILFFCNLERNTHNQISRRASVIDELKELVIADDDDEEEEEECDNNNNINSKKKS